MAAETVEYIVTALVRLGGTVFEGSNPTETKSSLVLYREVSNLFPLGANTWRDFSWLFHTIQKALPNNVRGWISGLFHWRKEQHLSELSGNGTINHTSVYPNFLFCSQNPENFQLSGGSRFGNQEIADFSEIFLGNFHSTGPRSENCGNFGRMERCHSNYTKLINFVISKWCQFQSTASFVNYSSIYQTSLEQKKRNVVLQWRQTQVVIVIGMTSWDPK